MMKHWSLLLLPLALGACTQSESREVTTAEASGGSYPARLPLGELAAPPEAAPIQPEGGQWQAEAQVVRFGVPGQPELFALGCGRAADGTATVRIARRTRAEQGAKALFALIGNGRIARLPLDAISSGEAGEWHGELAAHDARLDVLKGGNRIEATLPGGGTLMLPASREPGRLLEACRADAPTTVAAQSPAPSPALSPA